MKMSDEQKTLVKALLDTASGAEMHERQRNVAWNPKFYEELSESDVEFYFNRLMLTAHHVEIKRKREAELKETRLKGQKAGVENYMAGLLGFARAALPKSIVSFESGDCLSKITVLDPANHLHLILIFDKGTMNLKSIFGTKDYLRQVKAENLSDWDAGVAGHEQSELFKKFRTEIEKAAAGQ